MVTAGALHVALLWVVAQHLPVERAVRYVVYRYTQPNPGRNAASSRAITSPSNLSLRSSEAMGVFGVPPPEPLPTPAPVPPEPVPAPVPAPAEQLRRGAKQAMELCQLRYFARVVELGQHQPRRAALDRAGWLRVPRWSMFS